MQHMKEQELAKELLVALIQSGRIHWPGVADGNDEANNKIAQSVGSMYKIIYAAIVNPSTES